MRSQKTLLLLNSADVTGPAADAARRIRRTCLVSTTKFGRRANLFFFQVAAAGLGRRGHCALTLRWFEAKGERQESVPPSCVRVGVAFLYGILKLVAQEKLASLAVHLAHLAGDRTGDRPQGGRHPG